MPEEAKKKTKKADTEAKEAKPKKKPTTPRVKKVAPKEEEEVAEIQAIEGESEEQTRERASRPERYFESVGRRKTAVARVRLFTRAGDFTVNNKPYGVYFPSGELQRIVEDALKKMKLFGRFKVSIKVEGGGSHAQAEAVRHGLARCLTKFNPDFRKRLRRAGFITRDPRAKERKKFGLKKARKAPQWAKR